MNIENIGSVIDVLNTSEDKVTISTEEKKQNFDIIELVSFAPGGNTELDLWWMKFTLGIDIKQGNTNQVDFSSQFSAKRRTANSRFVIDYIGNISKTDAVSGQLEETINNQRVNFNIDKYATRYFFYTPLFGEYFSDAFQNIEKRQSLGIGIGYTLIDSDKTDWNLSAGPSYLTTKYISVQAGDKQTISSGSLSLSTDYESEINSNIDIIFKYNILLTDKESGGYSHHVIATLENELTTDFDLNISIVWDRINNPTIDSDLNIPEKNDYRLILGITYTY